MQLPGALQRIRPGGRSPRQDVLVHRIGKALILMRGRHVGGLAPHLLAGIAHRDAQAALLEHHDVGGLVADGRDGGRGNLQESRQPVDATAFVGGGMRHVEVRRLRSRGRDLRPERLLQPRFTRRDLVVVLADADDLDHAAAHGVERRHDRGHRLTGRRLAIDAPGVTGPDIPVGGACRSTRRGGGPQWPPPARAPGSRAAPARRARTDRGARSRRR